MSLIRNERGAYEWSADTAAEMIEARGFIVDIGQVTPVARKWLDRQVREGALVMYRGHWDTLDPGFGIGPLKKIWIAAETAKATPFCWFIPQTKAA